ncbi:MAG: hypothetical protein QNJ20_07260 [Paracoccaceae bacterium]|nr:hypothetical protein [Paracoccaceae bacterium]
MENILLYVGLLGTIAFGATFIILALRKPPTPPAEDPKARPEALQGIPTPAELSDMAEKFQQSGPRATAASLTVFFFLATLVVAGVIEVELEAGGDEAEEVAPQD